MKTRILIGIPSFRNDVRFLTSLSSFLLELKDDYEVSVMMIKNKNLADTQNRMAEECINGKHDYLLFMDDDHWGHTKKMLEALIKANTYMVTMKTHSRYFPYFTVLLKEYWHGQFKRFVPIGKKSGYAECDVTGFPMTLLRRDIFDYLVKPYFRARPDSHVDWATDVEFCERLKEVGIKPMGCFDYCLPHGDITEDNVEKIREPELKEESKRAMYNMIVDRAKRRGE